jgi:menaquinone-9 beta-reductase
MISSKTYQVSIVGGGLAGLTLAIQLADSGYSCILFEKNKYPFHKVCGEYISMESWDFLQRLGLNLEALNLPKIDRLHISSPSGKILKHKLDLGGFGISRYFLDSRLAEIAKKKGVTIIDDCRVNDIQFIGNQFKVFSPKGNIASDIVVGSWGKKSNLDTKLLRSFTKEKKAEKNYVGIKYHITVAAFPHDLIELHNFKNGYCGISKIENDRYCLCYLTDSENLKKYNGNVKQMEEHVLMKNPLLKKHLKESEFLFEEPLAISQIKIGFKSAVENHILMLGDTAGNIAPLSGNGMSIAMRGSFHLHQLIKNYFEKKITRNELETKYELFWRRSFKNRVDLSKTFQGLLKNKTLTNVSITILKRLPFLRNMIVRSTHGKPF